MSKTKRERLQDEQLRLGAAIAAQRRWIEEHGGDRAGYIRRYGWSHGSPSMPIHRGGRYGDGGDVIYNADKGELDRLEAAYVEVRRQQGVPSKPLAAVTKQDRRDFEAAHAEGLHDDLPRDFCPECGR